MNTRYTLVDILRVFFSFFCDNSLFSTALFLAHSVFVLSLFIPASPRLSLAVFRVYEIVLFCYIVTLLFFYCSPTFRSTPAFYLHFFALPVMTYVSISCLLYLFFRVFPPPVAGCSLLLPPCKSLSRYSLPSSFASVPPLLEGGLDDLSIGSASPSYRIWMPYGL